MPGTVSIVGGAKTTRELWRDYQADAVWALAYMGVSFDPPPNLLFEMHRLGDILERRPETLMPLRRWDGCPIYMLRHHPEVPTSRPYPLDDVLDSCPILLRRGAVAVDLFTGTFDYMLALAITCGFDKVQVFGFEMSMTYEYFYQRPGAHYWLGQASARGIEVWTPPESELLESRRYGYDGFPRVNGDVLARRELVRQSMEWR